MWVEAVNSRGRRHHHVHLQDWSWAKEESQPFISISFRSPTKWTLEHCTVPSRQWWSSGSQVPGGDSELKRLWQIKYYNRFFWSQSKDAFFGSRSSAVKSWKKTVFSRREEHSFVSPMWVVVDPFNRHPTLAHIVRYVRPTRHLRAKLLKATRLENRRRFL